MNEQELLQRIADLPRDIPPRNDPWQKIEPRLEDRSTGVSKQPPVLRVRRWAPVAAAAAAVLAVALLVMPVGASARHRHERNTRDGAAAHDALG